MSFFFFVVKRVSFWFFLCSWMNTCEIHTCCCCFVVVVIVFLDVSVVYPLLIIGHVVVVVVVLYCFVCEYTEMLQFT